MLGYLVSKRGNFLEDSAMPSPFPGMDAFLEERVIPLSEQYDAWADQLLKSKNLR
jgi:hypothetical protein